MMKEFCQKVLRNRYVRTFIRFFISSESDVTGISVAYYLLIGILPLLLILANLLPYLHLDATDILAVLKDTVPDSLYQTVARVVLDMINRPSGGLLSISILSALWTFSRCITMMQKAFDKAYGVEEGRNIIWSQILSFLMGMALQIVLGLSVFLTVFGRSLVRILHEYWNFNQELYHNLLEQTQVGVFIAIFLTMSMLYLILPNVKIKKFRYVLPGTLFVMVVFQILTNVLDLYLGAYLARMSNFRVAGSVVIFGIMLWFIFISKMLIWGAVVNATYQYVHDGPFETRNGAIKQLLKRDEEDFEQDLDHHRDEHKMDEEKEKERKDG